MQTRIDLTQLSTTFPDPLSPSIPRDDLVSYLKDRFSADTKVIVVQGALGSGRTSLLAQFASTYPDRSISFYIGTTITTSDPRAFLLDICEQLGAVLAADTPGLQDLDTDALRRVFLNHLRQLTRKARLQGNDYYFVIDGLEWIPSTGDGAELLSLLPAEPRAGIYLLASSEPGRNFLFPHETYMIPPFRREDTLSYFRDLAISHDDAITLHRTSGGQPGYLAVARRLIQSGTHLATLLNDPPRELRSLLQFEWNSVMSTTDTLVPLISLLAYSREHISIPTLEAILNMTQLRLTDTINSIPFLRTIPHTREVTFISDAYREFAQNQLSEHRFEAESSLIRHYSASPYERSSLVVLPELLAQPHRYDSLKSLLTPKYIVTALDKSKDSSLLRRTLRLANTQATAQTDIPFLLSCTLSSAVLQTVASRPVADAEVNTLLKLHDYDQALKLANQAVLAEDRLHLLAQVYSHMRQRGLSITDTALADLEQGARNLDVEGLRERAIDIAAHLFDLHPEAAIQLVERAAGGSSDDQSLDIARALLAVRVGPEPGEVVRARVSDQSLRDFARSHSEKAAQMTAEEILAEARTINLVAGKLHLLTTWCNANRTNTDSMAVVEYALELITSDPTRPSSIRRLRQISEPLLASNSKELHRLAERIHILRDTSIQQPTEELVRLDLILLAVEGKRNRETAKDRLLELYLNTFTIPELDIRCSCLMRILISLPTIDPDNSLSNGLKGNTLRTELEQQLTNTYRALLMDSAEQLTLTQRMLQHLARYDITYALNMARLLNTSERRDEATQEVIVAYAEDAKGLTDPIVVAGALQSISEREVQDITVVRLLEALSKPSAGTAVDVVTLLLRRAQNMYSDINKCFAYAYALRSKTLDAIPGAAAQETQHLQHSLSGIHSAWHKSSITLAIAELVAEKNGDLARSLLSEARTVREAAALNDDALANAYITGVRLCSRILGAMKSSENQSASLQLRIVDRIRRLPSVADQVALLGDLALRCHLAGRQNAFESLMRSEILPALDSIRDTETRHQLVSDIGPALYTYDGEQWKQRIVALSPSRRDIGVSRLAYYLLSGLPIDDPIDLSSPHVRVEASRVRQVAELIPFIATDAYVASVVGEVVSAILRPDPRNPSRERSEALIERDVLDVATRMEGHAQAKLPDSANIAHEGFLVKVEAELARLRLAAANRSTAPIPWISLAGRARAIPNSADRAYVLTFVGQAAYRTDEALGRSLLESAEREVHHIPNLLDRADRFQEIAKCWKSVNEGQAARLMLSEAMNILSSLSSPQTRDRMIGQISELAHNIDPNFADALVSSIENPLEEHQARLGLTAKSLLRDPSRIANTVFSTQYERYAILSEAASELLKGLNSGTTPIRALREVAAWLLEASEARMHGTTQVAKWALENALRARDSEVYHGELFNSIDQFLHVILDFGRILTDSGWLHPDSARAMLPDDMRAFMAGSRSDAIVNIDEWLAKNAGDYVKIYDPFFSPSDLSRLRAIPPGCRVFIVTSWKAHKSLSPGDREIENRYRSEWSRIANGEPPWTQVTVMGTCSGEGPLHNRYIVCPGSGLRLSTSINGVGLSDTELNVLSAEEAARIEGEFIDPQLGPVTRIFRGEELLVRVFML